MADYITADTIRALRERARLTQRELAERVGVTDKAVSKWETGRGLPDVTLVTPLAAALGVSPAELLTGAWATNRNVAANMRRSSFRVCPVCGNVLHAMGDASVSCCGIALPALEAEAPDAAHDIRVAYADGELYVTMGHPMDKGHFVSFVAYVTDERLDMRKLYPEQGCEARFAYRGVGDVYAFCNRDGLFRLRGVSTRCLRGR